MKANYLIRLFKIIQAEIRKFFRNPKLRKIFLTLLIFFIIITFLLFYLRWTRRGSQLVRSFISKNTKMVYQLKKLLKIYDLPYLVYYIIPSKLPRYDLEISTNNLKKLNDNLPQENGALLSSQYKKTVKADFKHQNQDYPVKVRYRGDKWEHWAFDKKSWRINFSKDNFQGKKRISLIIPKDREYFVEALSFYMADKMGLFTLENQFVELYVNGRYQGVYFEVEHWGKEVIERNKLESDTNLYGEADFDVFPENIYKDVEYFQKYVFNSLKPEEDKEDLNSLLDYLNNLDDEEFYSKIGSILDLDNFLIWQAHSALFFNDTSNFNHNVNIIFNRDLGKLQFIPWNVAQRDPAVHNMKINYNPLVNRILTNNYYLCQRNKILSDYVNNEDNLKDDLEYVDKLYLKTKYSFYRDFNKEFLNVDLGYRASDIKKRLIAATEEIKKELVDHKNICSQASQPTDPDYDAFLNQQQLFRVSESELILDSGNHYLYQDLIIPAGFRVIIKPGARLLFASGVSLLSYSRVEAKGNVNNEIIFSSMETQPWGVFALVGRQASQSIFSNIVLKNSSEDEINGILFTGGLASHYADLEITSSSFRSCNGDDSLNVKHANAVVKNCLFENNKFDAIDFDNSNGEIINNDIINSGNDGIDLGSADPLVSNNSIKNCRDKGISIGELSKPEIRENLIENNDIGIAVKDSSQPAIFKNSLVSNKIGLSSYQKKEHFPRIKFEFFENLFKDNEVNWELKDNVGIERNNQVE